MSSTGAPAPPASPLTLELAFLVVLALVLARRTYAVITGALFSVPRLTLFAGLYVLLFVALAYGTVFSALAYWGPIAYLLVVAYVAVPVVSAYLATLHVERVVRFEQRGGNQWYYTLSWPSAVAYLVLFLVRIVAEFAVYGPAAFTLTFPPPPTPSQGALVILLVVDLLFGVSMGLNVGRSIGVSRAYQRLPKSPAPPIAPSSPSLPLN